MFERAPRESLRPLPFVLSLLLLLALAPGAAAPLAAQEKGGEGLDFFHTAGTGAYIDLRGDLALPAGFFEEGSPRFTGRILLKGAPLGHFRDTKSGNADTVVARREMTPLGDKFPSRGTAKIELQALSLVSARPVTVKVGRKTETWDVKVALSSGRPSAGTMKIVQTGARGGTFSSEFLEVPVLTFVRRGDKAERTLDVGQMKLSPEAEKALTLRATNAPWAVKAPKNAVLANSTFNAGVLNSQVVIIRHNANKHLIEIAREIPVGPGPVVVPGH